MINIEVNNKKIEAKPGETILTALKRAGITVPTLCFLEGMTPTGSCRMCVVEIEGFADLIPSCAFPVSEGMKIYTDSQRVVNARKTIVELLLANHPDDCLYCPRNMNCELQKLSEIAGVTDRKFLAKKSEHHLDYSSPSIVRDPAKCILCGRCIRVCEEVQGISAIDFIGRGSRAFVGTAFNEGINISSCINCGQCINVCPTGALTEQSSIKNVLNAIADPKKTVVCQIAPSVSVTLGEEFGVRAGEDVAGVMANALKQIGFDKVFETSFSADLTIMEEASELVERIKKNENLPMFTSCSPGWIKFVEQSYPQFIKNLSTCKSPQQMLGALIKNYFSKNQNLEPEDIYSVSIMPCTAKKFEAGRPEMSYKGNDDIDAVLTTRELVKLIKMKGLDINSISPVLADNPFGDRSTAGKLFGVTGGVMEAAVRTAYWLLTGEELKVQAIKELRGLDGLKEATIKIGDLEVNVAVANGLDNARKVLDDIISGKKVYHFIEIMSCPGGCIAGGGQPIGADLDAIRARMQALYKIDEKESIRTSHNNPSIKRIYEEFLGHPNSEMSHKLLHTHYHEREILV
ncbi:MAG TPA: NADH-dependent [FeFe] hydrogenase, group A6 [Candidatus Kapabacteria bacterium]|nr:NADH-dependent [FeFe] hydrogenase, group A6 [Candidatus Kapabacteria bacterium]